MLYLLEKAEVLNTDQIKLLFFRDVSLRMAQKRLLKLLEVKRIKRDRLSISEPYFYYLSKKPGQVEHRLAVNWVYVWFHRKLGGWEKFHSFEWEVKYSILRADGFCALRNLALNSFTFSFVEFDVYDSGNAFDKVPKYNILYESREWERSWWSSLASGFPSIIVVTTGSPRRILDKVDKENRNGLEFMVYTYEQIKEECIHGSSSCASIRTV